MARVRQGDHTVLPATHIRTIPAAFIPTPGRDISHSFVTEGTAHGLVKHSMYLNTNSCVTNLQLRFIHCQVARCRQQHMQQKHCDPGWPACTIHGHGCSVNMCRILESFGVSSGGTVRKSEGRESATA